MAKHSASFSTLPNVRNSNTISSHDNANNITNKKLATSSSVTTLPSVNKNNRSESPNIKSTKNKQMQASMDELERLYEEKKSLEIKIEIIRDEIKKTIEITSKLENDNRQKERQVKNMLEKGSAEESTLIFHKELLSMEERLNLANRKYGEMLNATNVLRQRIEGLKEDNSFRTKQIADMTSELNEANSRKEEINREIENTKNKRQRLHISIMQLKSKGESEQKDFEEDIRWVRDSDQASDTAELLTGVKKRIEQRFKNQQNDIPTEWIDPEDVEPEVEKTEAIFLTTVDEGDEETSPTEVLVAPPTLSREEMYFVVRDLWKLRDELRIELGISDPKDNLDAESFTNGQLHDLLNEISSNFNDLNTLYEAKVEQDRQYQVMPQVNSPTSFETNFDRNLNFQEQLQENSSEEIENNSIDNSAIISSENVETASMNTTESETIKSHRSAAKEGLLETNEEVVPKSSRSIKENLIIPSDNEKLNLSRSNAEIAKVDTHRSKVSTKEIAEVVNSARLNAEIAKVDTHRSKASTKEIAEVVNSARSNAEIAKVDTHRSKVSIKEALEVANEDQKIAESENQGVESFVDVANENVNNENVNNENVNNENVNNENENSVNENDGNSIIEEKSATDINSNDIEPTQSDI